MHGKVWQVKYGKKYRKGIGCTKQNKRTEII